MKMKTQIRRTLASLVAIGGFSSFALVEGEAIDRSAAISMLAQACPGPVEVDVPAAAVRTAAPARADWRARVPATIARIRS